MIIVLDIGGTHIRVARSDDGVTLTKTVIGDTPVSFMLGVEFIKNTIASLAGTEPVTMIVGALAGVVDQTSGNLFSAQNLPEWKGNSLSKELASIAPTYIENDAALAGLAEAVLGAGKSFPIVAFVTASTGIGGARIVNQKIDAHAYGFEPGKQIIDRSGMGSVESLASGRAIEKLHGAPPQLITDKKVLDDAARDIAIALYNISVLWAPHIIVLGGPEVVNKPGIDVDAIRSYMKNFPVVFPTMPEVKLGDLGSEAGLKGALLLAKQKR